jgi:membrane protein implicated in regulation of membrane protease activity
MMSSKIEQDRNLKRDPQNRAMLTRIAFALNFLIFPVSSLGLERQIRVSTERAVVASQRSETDEPSSDRGVRRWAVGLASLFFIVLQSVCTVVMALSGVRLIIGLGALAAVAAGAKGPATGLHQDAIRIPMMALAVLGSCINLYMVWRIRSLRKRPSSNWRQQPISRQRLWGERVQITLAIVTLILVVTEFLSHHYIFRLVG